MIVLGIDVGGTKIAAGLVEFPNGRVLTSRILPTLPRRGGSVVLEDVERLARELSGEAAATGSAVQAIGIGVCELVDRAGEITSSNCLAWTSSQVRERFAAVAPTFLEADVRAGARAEALFGAGRGLHIFLYVSIGTGISCSLVISGEPFTGAHGASGTMATSPMRGLTTTAATALSLERFAAGPGLVARLQEQGIPTGSGEDVLARAIIGEAIAERIVRSAGQAVGASIGWLVNVLDPELVILGGGLGLAEGPYRRALLETARQQIWWPGHRHLPIVPAATGVYGSLIGAAAMAWQNAEHGPP